MERQAESPQIRLFRHIREKLPGHISLVDELAELLNLSNDSAYRRLRGEKEMGFEELAIVCAHYKVSLDHFLKINNEAFKLEG